MKHAREDYNRIQDPAGLIPEDEPVFLIRGQDVAAVPALRAYAMAASIAGADMALIAATFSQMEEMIVWQREIASKTPDLLPSASPAE